MVSVSLFDLLKAFHEVVKRFEAQQQTVELEQEEVTIEQKVADIRRLLMVHDTIHFSTLLHEDAVENARHRDLPGVARARPAS